MSPYICRNHRPFTKTGFLQAKSCLNCMFFVFSWSRKLPESYLLLCDAYIRSLKEDYEKIFFNIFTKLEYRIFTFAISFLWFKVRFTRRYKTRSIMSWIFLRDLGHFHHHKYRRRCKARGDFTSGSPFQCMSLLKDNYIKVNQKLAISHITR